MSLNAIAVFLDTGEPLFLSPKHQRLLVGIVSAGSDLEKYARTSFSGPLISLQSSPRAGAITTLEETIDYTDFTQKLRAHGVNTLIVPARSSQKIERWANRNHITLLGTPLPLQQILEDKIIFDTMMRARSIPVPERIVAHIQKPRSLPVVIQKRKSMGCEGTRFFAGGKRLPQISFRNSLVRTYIHGIPLGVSISMDAQGNFFCSALRRQCFTYENNFPQYFLGVQWLPKNFFSPSIRTEIETQFADLATLLKNASFIGVANIDFLLEKEKVYFIECNPRFSAATPHLFSENGLTTCADPWTFLINAFLNKKNKPIHDVSIPARSFIGSIATIDVYQKTHILKTVPIGYYCIRNDGLRSADKKDPAAFFLLHDCKRGIRLKKYDTLCTLFSTAPLFSRTGTWNARGVSCSRACIKAFTEK